MIIYKLRFGKKAWGRGYLNGDPGLGDVRDQGQERVAAGPRSLKQASDDRTVLHAGDLHTHDVGGEV